MAGRKQFDFCLNLKKQFPVHFTGNTLDAGSLDINGSNKFMFSGEYTGLDLGTGKNVDVICPVHKYKPGILFDCVISTEMLEHDRHYKKSLKRMFELLRTEGLLIITAATTDREEHGTYQTDRKSSPFTLDYYKNVTKEMIMNSLNMSKFLEFKLIIDEGDLFFWGVKI
ncbi:MAG: class I SAM-dependent methyltransferase [Mariniphaga sp.]|nr:class I SAM-dependent methyltransferase [Mariniphaga sp.]